MIKKRYAVNQSDIKTNKQTKPNTNKNTNIGNKYALLFKDSYIICSKGNEMIHF